MRKALTTIGFTMLIAVLSLLAIGLLFAGAAKPADANPNEVLARTLMPYLKDGADFRLTDAYPDPWDAVEIVTGGDALDAWEWRAIRAFDAGLSQLEAGQQLLLFWQDGQIARLVRFSRTTNGMPWFSLDGEEDAVFSREDAVFTATLARQGGLTYYVCVPTDGAVRV